MLHQVVRLESQRSNYQCQSRASHRQENLIQSPRLNWFALHDASSMTRGSGIGNHGRLARGVLGSHPHHLINRPQKKKEVKEAAQETPCCKYEEEEKHMEEILVLEVEELEEKTAPNVIWNG